MACKIIQFKPRAEKNEVFSNKLLARAIEYSIKNDKHAFIHFIDDLYTNNAISLNDIEELKKYLEKRSRSGDVDMTYFLANIYHKSFQTEEYDRAKLLYEKAIDMGSVEALTDLGNLYFLGCGVKKSLKKARELYEMAAKENDRDALHNLACMYYDGVGVAKNLLKAMQWYEKAAELGNPNSIFNLGRMYFYGEATKQDYATAKKYYEKAAKLGDASAFYELGAMYANGEGCEIDFGKALQYFELANRCGVEDAPAAIKAVKNHMKRL
ncbi:MAG: sel1 repeat family protein [Desulfovibrionaceae bacterium]|nr:sel1 repeat family protein [Desulfovibrionaceae bacterium]